MIGLVARRLARVVAVVIVVAVVAHLLAEAAPGTPAERAARAGGIMPADDSDIPAEYRRDLLDRVARQHDLDRPLVVRIASAVGGVLVGDWGESWRDGSPVGQHLSSAAGPTSLLVILSLLLALGLGIGGAIVSAARPGGPGDVALGVATAVSIALPPVWIAMLLLGALSGGGYVLPVLSMTLVPTFVVSRYARAALVEATGQPWAVAARARGTSTLRVVAVHALRASSAQLAPLGAIMTAYLFGSSMVIERVFGIRGLGEVLLDASSHGDAPLIIGVCVLVGGAIALASAIADVAAYALDPREREEGGDGS